MQKKFKDFTDDLDKRYWRMMATTISVLVLVGGSFFAHAVKDSKTRAELALVKQRQDIVLENAVSQKAINDIILTFENQTNAMIEFLPKDLQGYVKKTQEDNRKFRLYISTFYGGINVRGGKAGDTNESGSGGGSN